MKPGSRSRFARFGPAYFFGLPGNPVSVMVTLLPARAAALASAHRAKDPIADPGQSPLPRPGLRKTRAGWSFQRGVLERRTDGGYTVRSSGHQGAGVLRSMSEANCFIIRRWSRATWRRAPRSKCSRLPALV